MLLLLLRNVLFILFVTVFAVIEPVVCGVFCIVALARQRYYHGSLSRRYEGGRRVALAVHHLGYPLVVLILSCAVHIYLQHFGGTSLFIFVSSILFSSPLLLVFPIVASITVVAAGGEGVMAVVRCFFFGPIYLLRPSSSFVLRDRNSGPALFPSPLLRYVPCLFIATRVKLFFFLISARVESRVHTLRAHDSVSFCPPKYHP